MVILANPLLKYNCHAYAWHKYFSDCQKIWMDYPEAQVYMTDGSFLQKGYLAPSDSYPAGAEIISYQTPSVADLDHSARVYRASQKIVKSKWGAGCLVQHEQTHCPYYVTGKTNFVAYGVNPTWVS